MYSYQYTPSFRSNADRIINKVFHEAMGGKTPYATQLEVIRYLMEMKNEKSNKKPAVVTTILGTGGGKNQESFKPSEC